MVQYAVSSSVYLAIKAFDERRGEMKMERVERRYREEMQRGDAERRCREEM